jgi:hypothetical protein
MEKLTKSLHSKYVMSSPSLLMGKTFLKPSANSLFNQLINKIHNCELSIINYVKKPIIERKRKYEVSVENLNFKMSYVINEDLTSNLFLNYIESQKLDFNDCFIESHIDLQKNQYVYFIKSEYGYKIGKTKDINQRLNTFGVKLPFKIELYSYIETKRMDECEIFYHEMLFDRRLNGEWFNLNESDFTTIKMLSKNWGTYIKK